MGRLLCVGVGFSNTFLTYGNISKHLKQMLETAPNAGSEGDTISVMGVSQLHPLAL